MDYRKWKGKDVYTATVTFTPNGKGYDYLTIFPPEPAKNRPLHNASAKVSTRQGEKEVEVVAVTKGVSSKATAWLLDGSQDYKPKQENKTVNFNTNKMADRFFKKVDDVVLDLQTGTVGISRNDSVFTLEFEGDDKTPCVNENMLAMLSMPIPAFAQATDMKSVKVGDLIVKEKSAGWVIKINEKSLTVMKTDGGTFNFSPPKNTLMGQQQNVMVIRNMMGDTAGLQGMQSMLMPLMMMGGDNDLEDLMPMVLMSQSGMMGDQSGSNNMLQMMMMAKMFSK